MPFKRILTELVTAVPGASGAILADWEGEAVEQFSFYDDFEMKLVGAHKGIILNRVREAYADLNVGELQEIVISARDQKFLVGAIGPEYALVMTLAPKAVVGQALFRFRNALELLKKEIL